MLRLRRRRPAAPTVPTPVATATVAIGEPGDSRWSATSARAESVRAHARGEEHLTSALQAIAVRYELAAMLAEAPESTTRPATAPLDR